MIELLALAPLGVAAVFDAARGEVPDIVWLASIPIACIVAVLEAAGRPALEVLFVVYFAVAFAGAAIALWLTGVQGGADAKAIALLAVMAPWPVRPHQLPLAADALLIALLLVLVVRRVLRIGKGPVRFIPFLTAGFGLAWWLGDPLPQLLRAVHQ